MDSFGLYVKSKNDTESEIKLHVNLWELNKDTSYLDFGIWICEPKNLEALIFTMPFATDKKNFTDLTDIICKSSDLTNLIFNRKTSISTSSGKERNSDPIKVLTIFDKKDINIKETAYCYSLTEHSINIHGDDYSTVNLNISQIFTSFIAQEPTLRDASLYIRFRIDISNFRSKLLSTIEKNSWGLESGFTRTEIIDFKINEPRNMQSNITKSISKDFHFAKLNRVDFFIMELAQNQVSSSSIQAECRYLEDDWKTYLKSNKIPKMIAYQWSKSKKDKDEDFFSYNKLIKIVYSATNCKRVLAYLSVVSIISIISGIISSLILSCTQKL